MDWKIYFFLKNFAAFMFIIAAIISLFHYLFVRKKYSYYEILFRWLSLLGVGFVGIFTFVFHAFLTDLTAKHMGLQASPFQYEIAAGALAFGVLGILAFKASYGFRLANVINASICYFADAIGVIYQLAANTLAFTYVSTGVWIDIITAIILIICIRKLRPGELTVSSP